MKKTLIALAVVASAVVSGSAMADGWVEGGITDSIDMGGSIISEQPVWMWQINKNVSDSMNLNVSNAVVSNSQNVWSNVGDAFPILLGKTKFAYSNVSSGMSPIITYGGEGFAIKSPVDDAPTITLQATGKTDPSKVGQFKFKMNMYSLVSMLWKGNGVTTQDKDTYQMIADTSKVYGNGYFQNAGYVKTMTTDDVKDQLTRILGGEMISIADTKVSTPTYTGPNLFDTANAYNVEGVYASEYVANSGTLSFPVDGTPEDWKATLNVTVSYQ
ncbi:fimbrial protein [Escherichia coli]|uniref:F4 family fimbrial subunit n=1 Tax=Escherichia coli TaxID=562 RepID=UPI0038B3AAEB